MTREKLMLNIAKNIRAYRRARGLSQESLALEAGLNPAFLGHIERCLKCPTISTLNKIANALNIPIAELLTFPNCDDDSSHSSSEPDNITRIAAALSMLNSEQAKKVTNITIDIINMMVDNAKFSPVEKNTTES